MFPNVEFGPGDFLLIREIVIVGRNRRSSPVGARSQSAYVDKHRLNEWCGLIFSAFV